MRVHAKSHPELLDLQRLFATMRGELEIHLRPEEHTLFPACRALDEHGDASGFDESVVALLEDDHETTGDALYALRELSGGYDGGRVLCGTHRKLLHSLRALELDCTSTSTRRTTCCSRACAGVSRPTPERHRRVLHPRPRLRGRRAPHALAHHGELTCLRAGQPRKITSSVDGTRMGRRCARSPPSSDARRTPWPSAAAR